MPLPPRSPELNSEENIWQFIIMRQNWLSNRVFKTFDDIVDHCCFAWNTLIGGGTKSKASFCRIQDWRRIATRYDKLARNFLAATTLVGVLYWIKL